MKQEPSSFPEKFTIGFTETGMKDIALVGGKNASIGELSKLESKGIRVPAGFAVTSAAWWEFINSNKLKERITGLFEKLDWKNFFNLQAVSAEARKLILESRLPEE